MLRIRIRRLRAAGDPRYFLMKGSDTRAMIWGHDREVHVVVESELEAMLLSQEAGDLVGVVALGNAQARPDKETSVVLRNSRLILLALDADTAGAKEAWLWWKRAFSQAERWPPIDGKDPGEMWAAGVSLAAWVMAGIDNYSGSKVSEDIKKNVVIDNSLEREEGKDLSPEGLGDLLDRVFSGRLSNPVPLPVLPACQDILGERIWVCPDGVEKDQTSDLSFTEDELRLILPRLKQNRSLARIVLEAKKIFRGTIMGFPNRMPDEEIP